MGIPQRLGTIPLAIFTDASNNVGIGGSPSGSFKFEVTGTGRFSSRINGVVGGTLFNTAGLWLQGSSSTDGIAIGGTAGGDKNIDTYGGILKINATSGNGLSVNGTTKFDFSADRGIRLSGGLSTESVIAGYQVLSENLRNMRISAQNLLFNTGDGTNSTGTERMAITTTGTVSISGAGRTWNSSYRPLEIGTGWGMMAHATNSDGYIVSNAYYDNAWRVASQSGIRFSILRVYDGLLLETANNTASVGTAVATTNVFIVAINGNVTNTNGSYGTISSDRRLKENIVSATPKLDDIMKLNVVNFNLIGNEEKHIGFIAQEMQEVFPSFVYQTDTRKYDEEGNVISGLEDALGVKTGLEFAILVKALQEANTKIDELSAKVSALENKS
jgi:hypothetical protein